MCANHARDGALVGDGERAIAQLGGAMDQLFGPRGAAQEAVIGEAMQLGVAGDHF